MRRLLLSSVIVIFLCAILILQFFGGVIRAKLSPKVEVARPQIHARSGNYIEHAVPLDAIYMDENGMMVFWLAVEDDSSGEKCYSAKRKYVIPGDMLDGYMSVRELSVTSIVILSDTTELSEGQRVEIMEVVS